MRASPITSAVFLAAALACGLSFSGCSVSCIEDGSTTRCSAKSLQRYDGAPVTPAPLDVAPGTPITIDVQYGNVLVERSTTGKLEVQFAPFVYAGYDEKASADQQLAQNLRLSAAGGSGATVVVQRAGGSNGLGANAVVRVPDQFSGTLTVVNRGDGPLNNFDLKITSVAAASALVVTNSSLLGNCWVQGAPTVRSSTVNCGEHISVFDVSDEVNITSTETSLESGSPAIQLRVASVTPGSRGGRIVSSSGAVSVIFPRAGGYVLNASSPVLGTVQEAALTPPCAKQESGPNAKIITCGSGPTYELIAGASPNYIGQPRPSDVQITFQ